DVEDDDIAKVLDRRRTATVLDLTGCGRVTDRAVNAAARALRSLHALSLDGCPRVTGGPLGRLLLANNGSLTALGLGGCLGVDEAALAAAAAACPQLRTLNLSRVPAVTDAVVMAVARYCRRLRNLHLQYCINVGDAGLQALA
ncbi:unnamed protein product, partial [Phaeothamnion confervicola]